MNLDYASLLERVALNEGDFYLFSKKYRKKLQYIERTIRRDAQESKGQKNCCTCFGKQQENGFQLYQSEVEKLNQAFYTAFNQMKNFQRYVELSEMLKWIQALIDFYHNRMKLKDKKKMDQNSLKMLRDQLLADLEEQFVNVNIANQMQNILDATFYLKTDIDGIKADKILRLEYFSLIFIQKVNKVEDQLRINLKNYIFLQHISNTKFPYILCSVFKFVVPSIIRLQFKNIEEREQLLPQIREIVKRGKLQRLVHNFDLENIIFNGNIPNLTEEKGSQIFGTVLFHNTQNSEEEEEEEPANLTSYTSPRLFKQKIHKVKMFKKISQVNYYNEIKQQLIETLDILADKKIQKNKKIQDFLNKNAHMRSKKPSKALLEACECQEARVVPNKNRQILQNQKSSGEEDILQQKGMDTAILSILGVKRQKTLLQEIKGESFQSESPYRDRYKLEDQIIEPVIRQSVSKENIYAVMYPHHHLPLLSTLQNFNQVQVTDKIWKPEIITTKSTKMLIQTQKELMAERIRLFEHKKMKNKFKIILNIHKTSLKSLVSAITDIKFWSNWHPNIKEVTILQEIQVQNSVIVSLKCKFLQVKYEMFLRLHLFKVENKYFLVAQTIKNPHQKAKSKSYFSFLWPKQNKNTRQYNYILFTLQNYGNKQGHSQILIDIQLSNNVEKNLNLKKEQITFMINFYYVTNYWKSQTNIEFVPPQISQILSPYYSVQKTNFQKNLSFT